VLAACDNHVGLRTNDVEAASQSWCDALGGEKAEVSTVRSSALLDQVFGPGTRLRSCHVLYPGGGGVELFEFVEPRSPLPTSRQTHDALMHFAFTVDDIDGAVERILAAGGSVPTPPWRLGGAPDGPRSVYCLSPEGHAFELVTIDYSAVITFMRNRQPAAPGENDLRTTEP
jgi:catechol 2,3-dioxygenase-like lactoylglutathione lyase family enzyme